MRWAITELMYSIMRFFYVGWMLMLFVGVGHSYGLWDVTLSYGKSCWLGAVFTMFISSAAYPFSARQSAMLRRQAERDLP